VVKRRPNFNQSVRALIRDVAAHMPEFSHIKASRILVVAGEARRASRGTVKPLMSNPVQARRKSTVKIKGRRMLYCITLRPLFFRSSTAQDRIGTLLHELYHISPRFDGTLDEQRRHESVGREFGAKLRPLVRRYLRQCPPELWAAFAYDGEVRVQQWLERPGASLGRGKRGARRIYTEAQLFLGPVRMITRPPRT
jgi:predicted metallopeptidase